LYHNERMRVALTTPELPKCSSWCHLERKQISVLLFNFLIIQVRQAVVILREPTCKQANEQVAYHTTSET